MSNKVKKSVVEQKRTELSEEVFNAFLESIEVVEDEDWIEDTVEDTVKDTETGVVVEFLIQDLGFKVPIFLDWWEGEFNQFTVKEYIGKELLSFKVKRSFTDKKESELEEKDYKEYIKYAIIVEDEDWDEDNEKDEVMLFFKLNLLERQKKIKKAVRVLTLFSNGDSYITNFLISDFEEVGVSTKYISELMKSVIHEIEEEALEYARCEKNHPIRFFNKSRITNNKWKFSPVYLLEEIQDEKELVSTSLKELYEYDPLENTWKEVTKDNLITWTLDKLYECYDVSQGKEVQGLFNNLSSMARKVEENPYYINFKNGIYDLKKGELIPHTSEIFTRNQISNNYNKDADTSEVLKDLRTIFNHTGEDQIRVIKQILGSVLFSSNAKIKKIFLMFGSGNNGKSTLIFMVEYAIGKENCSSISLEDIASDKNYQIINTRNKLFNNSGETEAQYLKATKDLKAISSSDSITARQIYEPTATFIPYCKMLVGSNSLPSTNDRSDGWGNRICIVPMPKKLVSEEKYDPQNPLHILEDKSILERIKKQEYSEALLKLMIEGLHDLINNNFVFSETKDMENAKKGYLYDNNIYAQFIDEECELGKNEEKYYVDSQELFSVFLEYAKEANSSLKTGRNTFYKELEKMEGITRKKARKDNDNKYFFFGIKLKNSEEIENQNNGNVVQMRKFN